MSENQTPLEHELEEKNGKLEIKRFVVDILETVVLALVLFVIINLASARVRVDGFSMEPTLKDGEFILVNRLAYTFNEPQRGEIIVFESPATHEDLIKRVIGLPGDEIIIRDGNVFVNRVQLEEPYIAAAPIYSGKWQVAEGTLFVLGDNRNDSSDSHAWGLVPIENVIGQSILIYWPIDEWETLNHNIISAGIS
ncbi:signal peptidase I [Chloroflexota bacterium]